MAEVHRFKDSVSLLDARLKDESGAKFKHHRELSGLTETILTLLDSVVFQIDARHHKMFFATRTHRLKIVFQLASLPCL